MKPIKILIGGSPCTYWSIMQGTNKRELTASGQGWELFKNYLIAKEKFKPDYFLYENNSSASILIKEQIEKELKEDLMDINSNLVSAQNRKRFYVFNKEIVLPKDKNIKIESILDKSFDVKYTFKVENIKTIKNAIPKIVQKYGYLPKFFNAYNCAEIKEKTNTLTCGSYKTSSCAMIIIEKCPNKKIFKNYYRVKDNKIKIEKTEYPIELENGLYIFRQLTPNEAEKLQTMPINYTEGISDNQRFKCLGNGWTADIIIYILEELLKGLPKDTPIKVLSMYDGIGTGRYCLEKLGFTNITYKAYEIDEYAIKIALKNYSDIIECGDAFSIRDKAWKY